VAVVVVEVLEPGSEGRGERGGAGELLPDPFKEGREVVVVEGMLEPEPLSEGREEGVREGDALLLLPGLLAPLLLKGLLLACCLAPELEGRDGGDAVRGELPFMEGRPDELLLP